MIQIEFTMQRPEAKHYASGNYRRAYAQQSL
jgi:hypothetical protein